MSSDGYTTVYHKDELLAGNLTSYLAGLRKLEDKVELDFNREGYAFQLKVLSLSARIIAIIFVVLIFLCLYKKRPKRDIVVLVLGVLICLGLGLYLQAKQRDENILKTLVQELEVNIDGRNEKFKVYTSFTKENVSGFIDINNNDIPDCIEHSDFWTDTDGDGLSDYYELCLTGTSPLLVKTYATDLADSNYDTDKDGLSNFYELKHELEALNTDSDFDGLEDLSEVEIGTDSLDWDTDKDGASDGWEVSNGYDPLRKEELFENTAECFSKGNNTKNDMIARAKVKASGDVIESLDIEEYNTMLVNDKIPGYIGSAFNFTLDGEFEEAEITFEFDKYNLGYKESDFVPCIYYFNEDTQLLEELDCDVTDNCVTAKVEHFSVYILLNKVVVDEEIFADMFRHDLDSKDITIEFVLDRSKSMSETDPTGQTKEIVSDFVNKISASDYNISGLGLVTFTSIGEVNQEITANVDKFKQKLFSLEIDDGNNELSGTNIIEGLEFGLEQLKTSKQGKRCLILVTDGQVQSKLNYEQLLKRLRDDGIVLYCINFSYSNENVLKFMCLQTGGLYFEADSVSNGNLSLLFDNLASNIITEYDVNTDNLLDSYTRLICNGILKTGVGTQLYGQQELDDLLGSSDIDGDGLLNGEEIEVVCTGSNYYIKVHSSPLLIDTDNDGIEDNSDTAPLTKGLKNGIVGKLYIVACSKKTGHA